MKIRLVILMCLLTSGVYGQTGEVQEAYTYRYYATQSYQQQLFEDNASTQQGFTNLESLLSDNRRIKYTPHRLAVVFHILKSRKSPTVSRDDILEQLAILNQDFSRRTVIQHKADTLERFAMRTRKMDISFCFPRRAPNGKRVRNGIFRYPVDTLVWSVGNTMKHRSTGGVNPWNPKAYINVWVVDLPDNIAGYAQLPGGPAKSDGIVINYDFFGVKSGKGQHNQGRTLTHLMGSYLGLHELWNEFEPCADDGVRDTPIHNAPNVTCARYKHVSTCEGYPTEMFMNFMDGSPDRCLRMFTAGQKHRIQKVLYEGGPRARLTRTGVACNQINLKQQSPEVPTPPPTMATPEQPIIIVFPNPISDVCYLDIWVSDHREPLTILFSDINGRVVRQLDGVVANNGAFPIRTSEWISGLYLISVYQSDKRIGLKRIFINR